MADKPEWIQLTSGRRKLSLQVDRIDWIETSSHGDVITLHINGSELVLSAQESEEFQKQMAQIAQKAK
jgi:hypothetical protein